MKNTGTFLLLLTILFTLYSCSKSPKQKGIELGKEFCEISANCNTAIGNSTPEQLDDCAKRGALILEKQMKIQAELPMGELQDFLLGYQQEISNCSKDNAYIKKELSSLNENNSEEPASSIITNKNSEKDKFDFEDAQSKCGKYVGKFGDDNIEINIVSLSSDGKVASSNNIFKGKKTVMKGTFEGNPIEGNDGGYTFTLLEPQGKSNGIFTIYINRYGVNGNWVSFDGKLKREFELMDSEYLNY